MTEQIKDYMNGIAGVELNEKKLNHFLTYGISWCENGQKESYEKTTICGQCIHAYDCECVWDQAQSMKEEQEV